jgi:hypothetical protein
MTLGKNNPRDWQITVKRRGCNEVVSAETFTGTELQAEQRMGEVWNDGPCMQPGRFRATLKPVGGRIIQTIE